MPSDQLPKPSSKTSWYSWILLIAVLAGVSYYVYNAFGDLAGFDYRLNRLYLGLSFFFMLISYLIQLLIWFYLARSFGIKSSFLSAAKAWSLSQLGKYVPGKIGLLLIRMDIHKDASKRSMVVATVVEFITTITASCIFVLISIAFIPEQVSLSFIRWIALTMASFLLIILYPPILKKITNYALGIIKRAPLENLPSYTFLLKLVGFNMLVFIPYGLGLFFAFNCFHPLGWNYFLIITGVYYAAALLGVAAIFAPAGIGVREGIIFLILPALIPKPVVIFATLLTRIIITFSEIFLAAFFFLMDHYAIKKSAHKTNTRSNKL